MTDRVVIRRGTYRDSIVLMRIARDMNALEGVMAAAVSMGTPLNLDLLERQGFVLPTTSAVTPDDLVIAVRGTDAAVDGAIASAELLLEDRRADGSKGPSYQRPRTLASIVRARPELNMAVVSVPGPHATYEVASAIEAGLNVFCFSDGVTVEDEAQLKRRALDRGLLLLGPDCGTACIDGVGLGFANAVARGPVGIVGASGTGIQELACLLDAGDLGVSQALGVGGRDMSAAVGGLMTLRCVELLAADPGTEAIVVVTKPPDPGVATIVADALNAANKPALLALPGSTGDLVLPVPVETSLKGAAEHVLKLFGLSAPVPDGTGPVRPVGGYVRGLYCGGSLCLEAMAVIALAIGRVASNIPLQPEWRLADVHVSEEHTFIDFGDDALTQGRAHPMLDPTLRIERFKREAADPAVGAIMLDVVLGYGAHPDPAGELVAHVSSACAEREDLIVVVSVCGTAADPQGLDAQIGKLRAAGAVVTRASADAARIALEALGARGAVVDPT